jgi:hypothetical protein
MIHPFGFLGLLPERISACEQFTRKLTGGKDDATSRDIVGAYGGPFHYRESSGRL